MDVREQEICESKVKLLCESGGKDAGSAVRSGYFSVGGRDGVCGIQRNG